MKNAVKQFASLGVLLLLLCGMACFFRGTPRLSGTSSETYVREFEVFNTQCRLTLHECATTEGDVVFRELDTEMRALHNTLNAYDPESELSKLNIRAADEPVKCSDLLWEILLAARDGWRDSDGLFDVTVGPLLGLWGFHAKRSTWPTDEEIAAAKAKVGFNKLILDEAEHTVRFGVNGMKIDFGGIAKGFALSKAIAVVKRHGLKCYLIDLGGNIYCSEIAPRKRNAYAIGVRNPRAESDNVGVVSMTDCCIATSGDYERYRVIAGKKVGHLMDPRTGQPCGGAEGIGGVTVVVRNPTLSDVYSTTAFVGGEAVAKRLAETSPAHPAFIFVYCDEKSVKMVETVGDVSFTKF